MAIIGNIPYFQTNPFKILDVHSLGHASPGRLKERGVVRAVAVVISIIGFVSLDSGQGTEKVFPSFT